MHGICSSYTFTFPSMAAFQTIVGGYKMPSIGLGTLTILSEEAMEKVIDTALEAGYRHFDTAALYGNEYLIGRILKKWFSSGKIKREDIFITTKLPPSGNRPEHVEYYLKKSLADLQLEYVDLYLIHFPIGFKFTEKPTFPGEPVETDHVAVWKKLEEQVDSGRVRSIGISNFNIRQMERILKIARIKPACNQVELTLYLQQKELVEYCHKNGIAVTGYGSLGRAGMNEFYKKVGRPLMNLHQFFENETVKKIATKYNKTPAQVILRFFVEENVIMIPKSATPERIRQNIDVFDFSLDSDDITAMRRLDKGEVARLSVNSDTDAMYNHPEYPFPK